MIVLGVLQGIVIAVVLAVLLFFRRSWQPHGAVLGQVERHRRMAQRRAVPRRAPDPGDRGLPLGGAAVLRQLLSLPHPDPARRASRHPSWVVVQCEAMTDIDVSAARMLEQLDRELNARASTWRSSRCAPDCRSWFVATVSSRRSIVTASIRRSK